MSKILVPDWLKVLWKAWSIRLMALAGLMQGGIEFVPYVADYLPRWVVLLIIAASVVARIIPQKGLSLPEQNEDDQPWGV